MTNTLTQEITLADERRARILKAIRPWLKPKIIMGGTIVFL